MLQTLLRDRVVIVHPSGVPGAYGSTTWDWPAATRTIAAAAVQPLSSSENVVLQERTETRWRLIVGAHVALSSYDRVEWDGGTYEVDGGVERHKLAGRLDHREAVLSRVEGG